MIALKLQEAFRMGKTMVYFGSMPKLPQVLSSDNAGMTNISFFQIIGSLRKRTKLFRFVSPGINMVFGIW